MKNLNIAAKITVCSYEELNEEEKKLINVAKEATQRAYAPYSRFQVGAAVQLANGEIVSGNNQENAAFPSSLCAERTTLFYANSRYPDQPVCRMAIAAYTGNDFIAPPITPCGGCRQVILEAETRYGQSVELLLYGKREIYKVESIKDLLPLSFDGSELATGQ